MSAPEQPSNNEVMDWLVRNASFSADSVAIGFVGTNAQKTKVIIKRSLEALIANGQIKVVPVEEWNDYYVPDPPYELKF